MSLNNLKKRGLADRRWAEQLVVFKRILIAVHFVALIYLVHIWWNSNNDGGVHWRYEWIHRFGIWDILFVILLTAMMVIWRVTPRYSSKREYGPVGSGLNASEMNSSAHVMDEFELDLEMGSDVEIEELLQCSAELDAEVDGAENSMKDVDMFWI